MSRFTRLPSAACLVLTPALALVACDVEGDDVDALPGDACVPTDAGDCSGEGGEQAGGGGGNAGGGGGATGGTPITDAPSIDVIWEGPGAAAANDDDSVTVAIDDGPEATHTYRFGFAETGADNGWFGEDCLPGEMQGKDVCHDVGEEGGVVESVSGVGAIDNTHTLLFKASADAGNLTYVVIQVDTNRCWSLGDDPAYYVDSVLHCEPYDSP